MKIKSAKQLGKNYRPHKRNKNLHLLIHSCEKNNQHVRGNDSKVLGNNYR